MSPPPRPITFDELMYAANRRDLIARAVVSQCSKCGLRFANLRMTLEGERLADAEPATLTVDQSHLLVDAAEHVRGAAKDGIALLDGEREAEYPDDHAREHAWEDTGPVAVEGGPFGYSWSERIIVHVMQLANLLDEDEEAFESFDRAAEWIECRGELRDAEAPCDRVSNNIRRRLQLHAHERQLTIASIIGSQATPPASLERRSPPMSKAELARRITGNHRARSRDLEWDRFDLRHEGGKRWTVSMSGMDTGMQQRIEQTGP